MANVRFFCEGMIGNVRAEITTFTASGGSIKQVQITLVSGHRLRVTEGMIAFRNAECLRTGDIIRVDYERVKEDFYLSKKDTAEEKKINTMDLVGIGLIEVLEIGSFSDTPDEVLVNAGRKPMEFTERTVNNAPTARPPAPPTAATATATPTVAATNMFQEDGA